MTKTMQFPLTFACLALLLTSVASLPALKSNEGDLSDNKQDLQETASLLQLSENPLMRSGRAVSRCKF